MKLYTLEDLKDPAKDRARVSLIEATDNRFRTEIGHARVNIMCDLHITINKRGRIRNLLRSLRFIQRLKASYAGDKKFIDNIIMSNVCMFGQSGYYHEFMKKSKSNHTLK